MGELLKKYFVKAPDTQNDLSDPEPFNLMFQTQIGPTGQIKGWENINEYNLIIVVISVPKLLRVSLSTLRDYSNTMVVNYHLAVPKSVKHSETKLPLVLVCSVWGKKIFRK